VRLPVPGARLFHNGGEIRVAPIPGFLASFPGSLIGTVQDDPEHLPGELRMPHEQRKQHLDRLVRAAGLVPDKFSKLPAAHPEPHQPVEVHQPLGDARRRQQFPEPRHELDLRLAELQP
jgi:hypothetical protein